MKVPACFRCAALAVVALLAAEHSFAASQAEQLTQTIRIRVVDFRDATVQEAVDYLQRKAEEQLTGGKKLHIYCAELSPVLITFLHRDQPLYNSLREISRQTGLPLTTADHALSFGTVAKPSPIALQDRMREADNIRAAVFRFILGEKNSKSGKDMPEYPIKWLDATKVKTEVWGEFGSDTYEVTHTTKGWRVTKRMIGWIVD